MPSDYGPHAAHVCLNKECLATAALSVTLPRIGEQFDWSIDGVETSHDSSRAPGLAIQRIFPPTTTTFSLFPPLVSLFPSLIPSAPQNTAEHVLFSVHEHFSSLLLPVPSKHRQKWAFRISTSNTSLTAGSRPPSKRLKRDQHVCGSSLRIFSSTADIP